MTQTRNTLLWNKSRSALASSTKNALAGIPTIDESEITSYQDLISALVAPSENQVDRAFQSGTKMIAGLLKNDKIDFDTAKKILSYFANLYIKSKLDSIVNDYIDNKLKDKVIINYLFSR